MPVLADVVLVGFWDQDVIAFCHISVICPIEIEDVSVIVEGTVSEFPEVEGAHPVWSDGCGRWSIGSHLLCR